MVIYAERKKKLILVRVYICNRSEKLLLVIVAENFTIRHFAH